MNYCRIIIIVINREISTNHIDILSQIFVTQSNSLNRTTKAAINAITVKNVVIKTLIINAYIVISAFVVMVIGVSEGAGAGQLGDMMKGVGYFKAFTIDSNVLIKNHCFL